MTKHQTRKRAKEKAQEIHVDTETHTQESHRIPPNWKP